jgi:hypothetical protein
MDLGSVNAPPPLYTETLALIGQFRMILKIILKNSGRKLQAASFKLDSD